MRRYIFLVILIFSTTGCIPKYVERKPSLTPAKVSVVTPQVQVSEPQTQTQIQVSEPQTQISEPAAPQEIQVLEADEAVEEQKNSTSYKVTMKTKKFAFSDTGFLVNYEDSMHLNVLAMGKSVLDLKIQKEKDDICVGSLCNSKHGFNQSFLVGSYPDVFIENVLQGKPIFNQKHLTKTSTGFIQKIVCERYGIKYQVTRNSVYFKDKKNNILIKLKEIH